MKRMLIFAVTALILASCNRPQETIDQLRTEITSYKSVPTDAAQAKIEEDFHKLDTQIEQLIARGKTEQAAEFRATAENLRSDYRAARMVGAVRNASEAVQSLGNAFKEAGKSIGDAFKTPSTPTPAP